MTQGEFASAALAVSAVVLIGWAMRVQVSVRRRRWGFARRAGEAGLRFVSADPFDLPDMLFRLRLFGLGHSRLACNVVYGMLDGVPVRMFDYQYEVGWGFRRKLFRWQVTVAVLSDLRLGGLLVAPADDGAPGCGDEPFGYRPAAFEAPPFAQQFRVSADDPQFAYELLHPRMTAELTAEPAWRLETQGWIMCVYQPGPLGPDEAFAMLSKVRRLPDLMPAYLRQALAAEAQS